MNKLITCLVLTLCYITAFSQYYEHEIPRKEQIKKLIWNNTDPDFSVTQCNEKWKNESAVILCKKYEYYVQKGFMTTSTHEEIYTHTRILLIDKAAVNEYSTFKFDVSHDLGTFFGWGNNQSIYIGIKVVKSNGNEHEVNIDESLIDEIKSGRSKKQIQKVAIPGLEAGDILDYYYASERALNVQKFYPFSPVIYPLVDVYPIVKHKIEMHIMRRCYFNARSMNGAPEFNLQEDSKRKNMVYTITDTNREKLKTQLWLYPLREMPVIIFQAYYVGAPFVKNRYCFYDKEDVIKKDVSDTEILEYLNNQMSYTADKTARKIDKYLKKNFPHETDPATLARAAFYLYRQYVYAQNYQTDLVRNYYKIYPPNDYTFTRTMSAIFTRRNIKHSIIVTIPREIGNMDDLVITNQLNYLVRLDADTPVYISSFARYSMFNELDMSFQGNKAKAMHMASLPEYRNISDAEIPGMKYQENALTSTFNISFDPDDTEKLSIDNMVSAIGLNKQMYQSILITPEDYIKWNKNGRYGIDMADTKTSSLQIQEINLKKIKQREDDIKEIFKGEFDVTDVTIKKIEVLQPGTWEDKPELKFNINFEINKYITKAGNNIILEAGKLIGTQIVPEADDSVRKYNIYMPYARMFNNIISVEIPKGYTVKGIDKFTFNISNETGGFISSANVDGDKLVIKTSKYFADNYFPKDNWPKIEAFLNAANDFRNQKIMFVPVE